MHGMLSLWVLVAAFAVLAGWTGYVSVRLYRTCPVGRTSSAQPASGPRAADTGSATDVTPATGASPADSAGQAELAANQTTSPHPVT
ncbi:MAG TPA: hypothetical protein VHY58_24350 [Streptosporangiaceae bacterium]|jgi:hypothetical protein|nr:hypothetical protein [Streptosporangiaceae bacterium]